MTVEQFDQQFGHQKPYFEYWFGEPVQKPMPTWIHGLIQKIIMGLLDKAGYVSVAELKLKISNDFQPLPDVAAVLPGRTESPYPTTPVEAVVEILSPDDQDDAIISKCRFYHEIGIPNIFVVNPETRAVARWQNDALVTVNSLLGIPAAAIWQELERLRQILGFTEKL